MSPRAACQHCVAYVGGEVPQGVGPHDECECACHDCTCGRETALCPVHDAYTRT